jgi:hypothetical protein
MSVKQLAQTVRYGRRVTFHIFDGDDVTGYLAGMDDSYFLVLSPHHNGIRRMIINRSGNPAIELHDAMTYEDEEHRAAMEDIIGPFRGWIASHIFNGRNGAEARKAG